MGKIKHMYHSLGLNTHGIHLGRNLLTLLTLSCSTIPVYAASNVNLDFINTSGYHHYAEVTPAGTAYNALTLSEDILKLLHSKSLSDLEIINRQGERIPYYTVFNSTKTKQNKLYDFPFFPLQVLYISGQDKTEPLDFSYQSGEFSIELRNNTQATKHPDEKDKTNTIIIDTQGNKEKFDTATLTGLHLELDKEFKGLSLLSLEASDDLNNWTALAEKLSVARLDGEASQLKHTEIPLDSLRHRFIKLHWQSPNYPKIIKVSGATNKNFEEFDYQWSSPLDLTELDHNKGKTYTFSLSPAFNSNSLKFHSTAEHLVYTGYLYLQQGDEWREYTQFQFNIATNNGENTIHKIPLNKYLSRIQSAKSHWKIEFSYPKTSLRAENFTLQANRRSASLYFINDHSEPYYLALSNPSYKYEGNSTKTPLFDVNTSEIGQARIGSIEAINSHERYNWKRFMLWLSLILGVCLICYMSLKLIRELGYKS